MDTNIPIEHHQTDVLIIGGGAAASMALSAGAVVTSLAGAWMAA